MHTIMEQILHTPPQQLVTMHNFEQNQLWEHPIHSSDDVKVSLMQEKLTIEVNGNSFIGQLERPLLHQLGTWLWPQTFGNYKACCRLWRKHIVELPLLLADVLVSEGLVIRYSRYSPSSSYNKIYGIVSQNFVYNDQMKFRETFINSLDRAGLRFKHLSIPRSSLDIRNYEYNHPHEIFEFEQNEQYETQRYLILRYGRNNGYSAYKYRWGRVVLVCKNGLSSFEEDQTFTWHHTKKVLWTDFIDEIVASCQQGLTRDQSNIEARRASSFEVPQIDEFL